MRVAADVPLTGGAIGLLAWPARERVLAVQELCLATSGTSCSSSTSAGAASHREAWLEQVFDGRAYVHSPGR